MNKFLNAIFNTIGGFIIMALVALVMILVFTVVLPITAIVVAIKDNEPLAESYVELTKEFISKLKDAMD